jgi:hypothetical protein
MATCSALGGTTPDLANVARVALRQGSASNAATLVVDGIRVSNSWANGPLPVSFSSFNAKLIDQNAHLTWSTSSETNNSGFEIERSLDGSSFETIGFVKGAGNSNKTISYLFTDANLAHPIAYYRLKQVDFDGKFDYSETITVSSDEAQIEVTPNPFVENISIAASNQDQMVFAEIIDITGKVKASSTGMGNLTLDTKDLNQGVYFVRVNHGEKVIVKRIIKN